MWSIVRGTVDITLEDKITSLSRHEFVWTICGKTITFDSASSSDERKQCIYQEIDSRQNGSNEIDSRQNGSNEIDSRENGSKEIDSHGIDSEENDSKEKVENSVVNLPPPDTSPYQLRTYKNVALDSLSRRYNSKANDENTSHEVFSNLHQLSQQLQSSAKKLEDRDSPWIFLNSSPEVCTEEVRPKKARSKSTSVEPLRQSTSKRRKNCEPLFSFTPSHGDVRYKNVPTIGNGVDVRDSSIPEAGRGLFASRNFRKGELVTEYVGEIITREEARKRLKVGNFHYLGTLVSGMYEIDGIQEPADGLGAASFINHASKPHTNVVWAHVEDRILCFPRLFARATREIPAGDEIFLDYGPTYWARHKRWKLAIEKGIENLSDDSSDGAPALEDTQFQEECEKMMTAFHLAPQPVPPTQTT